MRKLLETWKWLREPCWDSSWMAGLRSQTAFRSLSTVMSLWMKVCIQHHYLISIWKYTVLLKKLFKPNLVCLLWGLGSLRDFQCKNPRGSAAPSVFTCTLRCLCSKFLSIQELCLCSKFFINSGAVSITPHVVAV